MSYSVWDSVTGVWLIMFREEFESRLPSTFWARDATGVWQIMFREEFKSRKGRLGVEPAVRKGTAENFNFFFPSSRSFSN